MNTSWTFPDVAGRDLLGNAYELPAGLPAALSIAVIAFKRWHQDHVDAWIARLAEEGIPQTPLGRTDLDRVVLELPVLSGRYQVVRRFIDGGMAASIKDPEVLARTITLYGPVDPLCAALGITSREEVSVRIVRRDGSVLWGTTGRVGDQGVAGLMAALSEADAASG